MSTCSPEGGCDGCRPTSSTVPRSRPLYLQSSSQNARTFRHHLLLYILCISLWCGSTSELLPNEPSSSSDKHHTLVLVPATSNLTLTSNRTSRLNSPPGHVVPVPPALINANISLLSASQLAVGNDSATVWPLPTDLNITAVPVNQTGLNQTELADYLEEVEYYQVWAAISNSLANWYQRKLEKNRTRTDVGLTPNLNASSNFTKTKRSTNENKSRRKRDEESVCYQNFGCFRDEGPFDYLDTLPASPESISTTFMLYSKRNPTEGQRLDYDNSTTLLASNFNASNDVKVIIHGFGSSSKRPWVLQMTEALLYLDDFNVINVDWENGSRLPNYVQAAANTQLIGKQIAKLIRMINFVTNLTPSRYHLIGFSLGAHVAGFTGMEIRNISRITGLDPASPLFEGYPPRVRLDPSDADFVDVIHSNGDSFIRGGLGSYTPMGHVDFYPNGGRVQVGCNSALMGALTDILYGKWNSLCNHRRAFRFFIDSTRRTCTFRAFACSSYEEYVKGHCFTCGHDGSRCSNMGYFAHQSKGRGNMYLVTREKEPFCVNQYQIRIESSREHEGQAVTWGRMDIQMFSSNGMNETFVLTHEGDELKEGGRITALIVAHPELINITHLVITYTRYKGWIYNGKNEWNIDRIELVDGMGQLKSFCHRNTKLPTTVSTRLTLTSGNCSMVGVNNNGLSGNSNYVPAKYLSPTYHSQISPNGQQHSSGHKQNVMYAGDLIALGLPPPPPGAFQPLYLPGPPVGSDLNMTNELNVDMSGSTTTKPSYGNAASQMFWQFLGYGSDDKATAIQSNNMNTTEKSTTEESKFVYAVDKNNTNESPSSSSTSGIMAIDSLGSNSLLDERSSPPSGPAKFFFVPNEYFNMEQVKHYFNFHHHGDTSEVLPSGSAAAQPTLWQHQQQHPPRTKRREGRTHWHQGTSNPAWSASSTTTTTNNNKVYPPSTSPASLLPVSAWPIQQQLLLLAALSSHLPPPGTPPTNGSEVSSSTSISSATVNEQDITRKSNNELDYSTSSPRPTTGGVPILGWYLVSPNGHVLAPYKSSAAPAPIPVQVPWQYYYNWAPTISATHQPSGMYSQQQHYGRQIGQQTSHSLGASSSSLPASTTAPHFYRNPLLYLQHLLHQHRTSSTISSSSTTNTGGNMANTNDNGTNGNGINTGKGN